MKLLLTLLCMVMMYAPLIAQRRPIRRTYPGTGAARYRPISQRYIQQFSRPMRQSTQVVRYRTTTPPIVQPQQVTKQPPAVQPPTQQPPTQQPPTQQPPTIDFTRFKRELQARQLIYLGELISQNANLNAKNPENGETLLHIAARTLSSGTVRNLLLRGASVSITDNTNTTPLQAAKKAFLQQESQYTDQFMSAPDSQLGALRSARDTIRASFDQIFYGLLFSSMEKIPGNYLAVHAPVAATPFIVNITSLKNMHLRNESDFIDKIQNEIQGKMAAGIKAERTVLDLIAQRKKWREKFDVTLFDVRKKSRYKHQPRDARRRFIRK